MIKYKTKLVEKKVPDTITCDVCKKEFSYETDWREIQEFHYISFVGGYDSIFGDGAPMKCHICQHCLKEKLGEYISFDEDSPYA